MEAIRNTLKDFFTSHWKYMAVSTACKLNIFDNLEIPKTAKQLAKELSLDENKLSHLLDALYTINFLDRNEHKFSLNKFSDFLTEDNEDSLKYACMNWSEEHLTAWQNLYFSIKTGKSSFEKIYGLPFFDYLNKYPEKLYAYHKAMYEYAKDDYFKLPELIDFKKYKSVMDVGGAYGALIKNIKDKNSNVECFLFDLPKVVEQLTLTNIKIIGGSFFEEIPNVSEVMILARILHDWNDEKAKIILKNCFEALPKSGELYIIENCSDKTDIDLSLLSLNMAAMCESYERTSKEYIALAENTGFYFTNELKLNELQTILIFSKK